MEKFDTNRLKFWEASQKDKKLILSFNEWKKLTKKELEKVKFLNLSDISDWDFEPLDEEEELYFLSENNPELFEELQNFKWEEFNKKIFLEKLRKELKQKEQEKIMKRVNNFKKSP